MTDRDGDLPPAQVDAHGRRASADRGVAARMDEIGDEPATGRRVHGEEQPRGGDDVRAVGERLRLPGVPPIAIENAIRAGFSSVLSVIRNAVARFSGRTRNSTRSAASLSYPGPVGYV